MIPFTIIIKKEQAIISSQKIIIRMIPFIIIIKKEQAMNLH